MIVDVTFEKTTYQDPPAQVRAVPGQHRRRGRVGSALDLCDLGRAGDIAAAYEHSLLEYATAAAAAGQRAQVDRYRRRDKCRV